MTKRGIIYRAEREYRKTGTLATDTYMSLAGIGCEPEALMSEWDSETTEEQVNE